MGILRADLLTHSQLQPTGSVFFDGTDDKITTTGFGNIGTSDFTLECWVYLSTTSGTQRIISCLLYTSPSPRDRTRSRMPSSA